MQHKVTTEQRLLNKKGNIAEPGYSTKPVWGYTRDEVRGSKWRLKEWDYYYIGDDAHGIALTISDVAYIGTVQVSLMNYGADGTEPFHKTDGNMMWVPFGRILLGDTAAEGNIGANVDRTYFEVHNDGETRHVFGTFENYYKSGETLEIDIVLSDFPEDSMVIATPFHKNKQFYYNQKINCMPAKGTVKWGDLQWEFSPEQGAMGTLDWGRGKWPYETTWYWGSGSMLLESGDRFGFNIGYGFGDTSAATENMLFWNGKAHKLEDVTFDIPTKEDGSYDYLAPWEFHETNGRFEMVFKPLFDRFFPIEASIVCMIPHQVFGHISGTAVLDDGTTVEIKDRLVFAEHVHNKW